MKNHHTIVTLQVAIPNNKKTGLLPAVAVQVAAPMEGEAINDFQLTDNFNKLFSLFLNSLPLFDFLLHFEVTNDEFSILSQSSKIRKEVPPTLTFQCYLCVFGTRYFYWFVCMTKHETHFYKNGQSINPYKSLIGRYF